MSKSGKISTDGGGGLGQNPFAALHVPGAENRPPDTKQTSSPEPIRNPSSENRPSRGRVDIVRETGNRGGKTVTVVRNFVGIGLPEKERLAKKMRAACGCGGTVKDGQIELQGDKREQVAKILAEAGFRPVFAGG
jgi:translation initiation factor 1